MKIRKLLLITLLLVAAITGLFTLYGHAKKDTSLLIFPKGSTYEKEWKKVDSLSNKGLTQSAIDVVNGIYKKAKAENNAPQFIKAVIHRMKFESYVEEYSAEKTINALQQELAGARFPVKPVLHSILAQSYWEYYEKNRWKFHNRTQTTEFKNDDISTWDLNHIVDQAIKQYRLSLHNVDSLKRTPINIYDDVLVKYDESRMLRPTLYDFLAHRAIDFYMNEEPEITRPAYRFELNDKEYFAPADRFIKIGLSTKDTMSLKFNALAYLKDLIGFHIDDRTPEALVDADLKRLKFVNAHAIVEGKDSLYLSALEALRKKYSQHPSSAEVVYEIATVYYQNGLKYDAPGNEQGKWDTKKALGLCEEAIKLFHESHGAKQCKSLQSIILEKAVSFSLEQASLPGKPSRALLNYRNLDKVYVRIAKIEAGKFHKAQERYYGKELIEHYLKQPVVKEWEIVLPSDGDYHAHSAEIVMPELPFGHYVVLIGSDRSLTYKNNGVAYSSCWITNISYIQRNREDQSHDFYVLHRDEGSPLKGVEGQMYYQRYDYGSRKYEYVKGPKFVTNENGNFQVPAGSEYRNYYIDFSLGEDRYSTENNFYQSAYYKREKYYGTRTFFFTDRAIYRPGQTVYFKGIVLETDGEKNSVKVKHNAKVTFYDVNHQEVSSLDLVTNEYGTFSGTFTAPMGVLNGQMRISDGHGHAYFSVEEYKRPKFEVEMKPVKGTFRLGDEVKAEGVAKAYAGSSIDNAQVKYRVVRNATFPSWWYWYRGWYPSSPDMEITNGVTTTNDTGGFFINFKAIPDLSVSKEYSPTYHYTVYADVTDINGETHSAQGYVPVGYTAMKIDVNIPSSVDKSAEQKFTINTTNLSGEPEPAKGKIEVFRLQEPGKVFRKRLWARPDKFLVPKEEYYKLFPHDVYDDEDNMYKWERGEKVFETDFDTKKSKDLILAKLDSWKQGVYVVEAKTRDRFGEEVKDIKYVTIYSSKENKIPANYPDWFAAVKTIGEPGEKAKFLIGSKNSVTVLFDIEHRGNIEKTEWLKIEDGQKQVEIPIEEKHRGNLSIHSVFIKNNRVYAHSSVITVPYTNKELDITFETFRNKLNPGQMEEWKLKLKGKNGEKVAAEMVATLYDASLDAFRSNYWSFNIYNSYYSSLYWTTSSTSLIRNSYLVSIDWNKPYQAPVRYYDHLNWFGYYFDSYGYYDYRFGYSWDANDLEESKNMPMAGAEREEDGKSTKSSQPRNSLKQDASDKLEKKELRGNVFKTAETTASGETAEFIPGKDGDTGGAQDMTDIKVRSNFNETAFFFPHLQTNENGEVIVKFTVPEALTRWKMMGFAHTTDLKYGMVTNELVTQKDLMVMPNAPRFFRENDKISFSAKISNLADKDLSGSAQLFLFDATTMKAIDKELGNTNATKSFTAKKGQSAPLTWDLAIPEGIGAVTYRIVAKANNFSDGEELAVPVLTNRMLVTESLPLPVRGNQTKTFRLDKLVTMGNGSKTLKNHKLTLEYTSNPAWYAVQALPYLMEYPYECSEQVFSRYYANSIASHIANSSPKIKAVFDSWKSQSPDALLSNLEKNQELKALLLEETPWVLDAKDESERKKRVALLFDLNRMSNELGSAMSKLQKTQSPNGGWPWFEGMPDDRYITQHIITGMGHLDHLGVKNVRQDSRVWNMVRNGVRYLDARIKEDYDWIMKTAKDPEENHLSSIQVQYLYARSYFKDISIDNRNQKAFDYFKKQAQKYWLKNSRYMQGMIALALYRYEVKTIPMDIIKSLKENSLSSEEMGMYWKENYAGCYWYQAPIEAQALLIEAFDEVANDKKSVEDMKVWLLKSKQTQNWRTTKATTEACYALLLRGTDWLADDRLVEITVGDLKIDPKKMDNVKAEAGTGYFKTSWSAGEIKPEMGKVTVTKSNDGVAWGALYWQYFEQLDKITPHDTPLKLNKKLFLERNTESGPVITPVGESTSLKPGDKIKVRIELRVDRDLEYVHMKDMRASGLEPVNVISRYKYQDGLGYYESTRDAATNFFFAYLPKGTYVFEYPLVVTHNGDFSNGVTTIQCMYAPEFTSHSEGIRIKIGK
jgi:uncharacterized protein YfaS (alpha-2-macroglobulin family)